MTQNFITCDRDQELLLPRSLKDWLPDDHLAWFVLDARQPRKRPGLELETTGYSGCETTPFSELGRPRSLERVAHCHAPPSQLSAHPLIVSGGSAGESGHLTDYPGLTIARCRVSGA